DRQLRGAAHSTPRLAWLELLLLYLTLARRVAVTLAQRQPHTACSLSRRRTKRGDERTPLSDDFDVLICGASFAGLAVARELTGAGARVLMIDRYEIGERQTSACAAPTDWLEHL